MRIMEALVAKFRTFREAEEATREYYRRLSPAERLEVLFQLRSLAHKDVAHHDGAHQGFTCTIYSRAWDEGTSSSAPSTTRRTMQLLQDWRAFIESLNSSEVEYLVVGAVALAYH